MATIDLSGYKLNELKGLQQDIAKEITERQQAEVKKAREQIYSIAQDLGVSVEELLRNSGKKEKTSKGAKVAAQYKNPADSAQTWSGRGRQPRWLADSLKTGKKLDDFRI